ncbi:MAG: class I SAM-dependent methyltransferase [Candidatus Hodarchaeales archaeon]|jgi:hypothetical protein
MNKEYEHESIFLTELILERKYKNIAEIGVFQGKLVRALLSMEGKDIIQKYIAVDPWLIVNESYGSSWSKYPQERWDEMYFKVCKFIPYFPQLSVIRMVSEKAAKLFWKGYFDLVYIDGDHRFPAALKDIATWTPLVKKGGIICGHDFLKYKNYGVIEAVDSYFGLENIITIDIHTSYPNKLWVKEL